MAKDKSKENSQIPSDAPKGVDTSTGEMKDPPITPPPSAPKVDKVELLNKIVAKDIVGKKELKMTKEGPGSEPRRLYTVYGTANGFEQGNSSYGEWTAFTGFFEAIRYKDGQKFRAPKCFLQGAAEGLLLAAIVEAKKNDADSSLQFAFVIGVKQSSRWLETDQGSSYEYTVESMIETKQDDPLAALRGTVMAQLPAPEPAA
jgi:hypothetical protein